MRSRRELAAGLALGAALLALPTPARAIGGLDGPNQPRGFVSGVPYTGGEYGGIDSVSPFSGSLVLALPVGQGFPVGGDGLSYGFTAFYNSNVWTYVEGVQGQDTFVVADIADGFNAGLGWSLSLGRLLKPNSSENPNNYWIYVGPDGSSHKFFDQLHPGENDGHISRYTRDGSYLRLKGTGPTGPPFIEFPNGVVHIFDSEGWPTQFHGPRLDGGGQPVNWVNITYPTTFPSNKKWRIEDSQGRVHFVVFDSNFKNGGKVESVELQAYGSTPGNRLTATYDFVYEPKQVRRTCHDTWVGNNEDPQDPNSEESKISVSLLRRVYGPIEAPASEQVDWLFWENGQPRYHLGDVRSSSECTFGGVLEGMELPTHGEVVWDWQVWNFPSTGVPYVDSSPGVEYRTIHNDASIDWQWASWRYTPDVQGSRIVTDVKDPENHVARYYFNAPTTSPMAWDYGLPINKSVQDAGGRYLSQKVIHANGTVLREIYLKFTKDDLTGVGGSDKILSNRRVVSSSTKYPLDANRESTVTMSEFDGLGHYRVSTASGNYPLGSNSRTSRSQWNDGRGCYSECGGSPTYTTFPPTDPWVLGTLAYTQQTESGQTATQQYTFDPATGALDQLRVLRQPTVQSDNDVVARYCYDTQGYLVSERYYGGDTNTLPGKVIGCGTSSDSTYRIDYEYQAGVRSRASYKTPAGGSLGFDNFTIPAGGVDATTGLVRTSCDSAGYCSEADYDALGRVTQTRGAASAGSARAATVDYDYTYAAGAWHGWKVETTISCPSGLTCSPDELAGYPSTASHFDGFGRPFKTDRLNPDGSWSKQYVKYTPRGQVAASSTWTTGTTGTGTEPATLYEYDPFGRTKTVTQPDGHVTTFAYTGDRLVQRTVQIASGAFPGSGPAPEEQSTTQRYFDRFGRLVRVTEPSGTGGAPIDTDYTYDVAGHLTQIAQGSSQTRSYSYDGRGFLLSETIPERGTTGNGTVYNCSFDALGRPWRSRETPCAQGQSYGVSVTFNYATQLTSVSEEGGNLLKQFLYEAGTGRPLTAKSFNYLPEVGYTTFEIDQTYAYGGIAGSVSGRTTQFFVNGVPQEQFTTTVATDRAGQLQSVGYPTCTGGICTSNAPGGRAVDYRLVNGALSRIPGFVDTPIAYHPNGMVSDLWHSNNMHVAQQIDTSTMMGRPKRLQVFAGGGGTIYDSGDFQYDGAGNIKAMGPDHRYRYDAVSRLLDSRDTVGGTIYKQAPTYDAYGNIQALTTGPLAAPQTLMTPTSASTNRLTTAGTTYDPMGNMTLWNSGPTYSYDRLNRMRRFRANPQLPGSEDWVFAYTADDERVVSKQVNGSEEIWTLRGLDGLVLREMRPNVSTNQLRDYVWSGRTLLAKIERVPASGKPPYSETTIHVATDHLDTPRWFTDATGAWIDSRAYYPFGKELTTSTGTERIQFTGHERDMWSTASTNDDLDYMHARHYNPQLGRFLQLDPLAGSIGRPQSLNRFAYVENNPIRYVDPTGLAAPVCEWQYTQEIVTTTSGGSSQTTTRGVWDYVCTQVDGPPEKRLPPLPPRPPREKNDDGDGDDDGDKQDTVLCNFSKKVLIVKRERDNPDGSGSFFVLPPESYVFGEFDGVQPEGESGWIKILGGAESGFHESLNFFSNPRGVVPVRTGSPTALVPNTHLNDPFSPGFKDYTFAEKNPNWRLPVPARLDVKGKEITWTAPCPKQGPL